MELQEATSIFFIGYRLPESDYLIRNLLVSNLNKDANIYISNHNKSDNMKNYRQLFGDIGDRIKKVYTDDGRGVIGGICKRIKEGTFEGFNSTTY